MFPTAQFSGKERGRISLRRFYVISQIEYCRDGTRYAYRLTDKGVKVALLFVLFHQRLRGPFANSLIHPPIQTIN